MKVDVKVHYKGDGPRAASANLVRLARSVFALLTQATQEELSTKSYQNRTNTLAGGTRSFVNYITSDGWLMTIQQGAEYGKYVQGRGYSRFTEIVESIIPTVTSVMRTFSR